MKQTENEVEDAVILYLRALAWIVRRNHVGVFYTRDGRPVRVGEPGECDWRAVRPTGKPNAHYLEFEAKRTGATPGKEQREYMAKRTHQGIVCIWADSLEMFVAKYQEAIWDAKP